MRFLIFLAILLIAAVISMVGRRALRGSGLPEEQRQALDRLAARNIRLFWIVLGLVALLAAVFVFAMR